jgi:hypothetical protein
VVSLGLALVGNAGHEGPGFGKRGESEGARQALARGCEAPVDEGVDAGGQVLRLVWGEDGGWRG